MSSSEVTLSICIAGNTLIPCLQTIAVKGYTVSHRFDVGPGGGNASPRFDAEKDGRRFSADSAESLLGLIAMWEARGDDWTLRRGEYEQFDQLLGDAVNVRLRDVTDADLPIFSEQQREPEANQMAAFPARAKDAFLAHWTNILGDPTVEKKTVLMAGNVAGNIVAWEQDGKRLVGYWIGKNYWRLGVATRALAEFVELIKTRPLYAHVAKQNVASIRVLEKCGFAICRQETESLGTPVDGVEELIFELTIPAGRGRAGPATQD